MLCARGKPEYNGMTERRRLHYTEDLINEFGYVAKDYQETEQKFGAFRVRT
jgi:hypothetical protein